MKLVKIDATTELLFAQAVALAQNGRMKSTVHVGGNQVFIQNMDNTILLAFKAPQTFEESFSFWANDYESPRIQTEAGRIVFITSQNGIRRTKVCASPKMTFKEVSESWAGRKPSKAHGFQVTGDMVSLLDEGLSHVELSKATGSGVLLVQRDIYNGARVEVEKDASRGSSLVDTDDDFSFEVIGTRTTDFKALFGMVEALQFYPQPGKHWMYFEDRTGNFTGLIAQCLYDELGGIGKEE